MGTKLNTKFKVGDKVKVISEVFWIDAYFTNKKGVVVRVEWGGAFPYGIKIDGIQIPVDECEIEKVSRKGEQLLLFEL